ncbi:MAG: MFS transporter [Ginsengibacter sp.]
MLALTVALYKDAFSGLSKKTWWLSVVMLINRSGTMVVPFMTIYLTQKMNVSISAAGFVMSLFGMGAVSGALVGGYVTDKKGAYYVQLVTLFGGGILFIILGQMRSYVSICVVTYFLAFVNEAFRPANTVAIADYSTAGNRTRSYSLNRLAINLGWGFGGGLGGMIASYSYELLFWVDGITNIAAAVLLLVLLSPSRVKNIVVDPVIPEASIIKKPHNDRTFMIFIVLVFLFAACFFQMFTTLPVFYKTDLHLSVFFIGIVMALNGLIIAVVEMILIFKLDGSKHPLSFVSRGTALISLSFFVLIFPVGNVQLIALGAMLLITFGEMLSMPFMNSYYISRTTENNRGQYSALFTVAWATAQATGPFAGALIAQHFGFKTLWLMIGCIGLILSLAYWKLQARSLILSP